jgi:hypothetical protein
VSTAKYIVKHTRNPKRKAELTPSGFRGRVFQASPGFLVQPIADLWKAIQAERRNEKALEACTEAESSQDNHPDLIIILTDQLCLTDADLIHCEIAQKNERDELTPDRS